MDPNLQCRLYTIDLICHGTPSAELLNKYLKEQDIETGHLETFCEWSEFKLNSDGLIPVIVQDYKTNDVLMLAYMNEEAFYTTLSLGKMTYYSRSRNELWTKGMTSGHYQYVKALSIDCDKDTILAKVSQIGAACHTGKRSCFYTDLVKEEYKEKNPLEVFENEYNIILDRKLHPKEGSYTNYLFDKGIDKILKKVGEVDKGHGAIVLTDMFGGTPSNLAISIMDRAKVEIIAGINLPMLIKLASLRKDKSLKETVEGAQEAGKKYINIASQLLGM